MHLASSLTTMLTDYHISNKIMTACNIRTPILDARYMQKSRIDVSHDLVTIDAAALARWFNDAFERSRFKSLTQLARFVGVHKATLSRIRTGSPHTITGKPSKPRDALIVAIAEALDADVNKGLFYAGHAAFGMPKGKPATAKEFIEALADLGVPDVRGLDTELLAETTPEQYEVLLNDIATAAIGSLQRKHRPRLIELTIEDQQTQENGLHETTKAKTG